MKIAFFGHFGSSNTGNESTLIAALAHVRRTLPHAELCCVCTNPRVVVERDGIDAVPITGRNTNLWSRELRLDRRLLMSARALKDELGEWLRAFRTLQGTDLFVVPGTGLLTDAFGLPNWGPYNLCKWVLLAKLRRAEVFFVSVGAGPIHRRSGRALLRLALTLADYTSYRDDTSGRYIEEIGLRRGPSRVRPDLVFGLPERLLPADDRGDRTRRVVGIGLMMYVPEYSSGDPRSGTYAAYLESLAAFVEWLLAHGYDVRLLLGDCDTHAVDDFESRLRARGALDPERVVYQPTLSVHDVLAQIAVTDVVVATRFHNIVLSMLLDKPVLAVAFHHKCSELMSDMGLTAYCHDIHEMSFDRLVAQFQSLERNEAEARAKVRERIRGFRVALDDQYALLFEPFRERREPGYGPGEPRSRDRQEVM